MTIAVAHTGHAPLSRHDRCDRCNAAAQVRALLPTGGELLFCGHHARAHVPRLRELGAAISPDLAHAVGPREVGAAISPCP
jgi:hypothetical protein